MTKNPQVIDPDTTVAAAARGMRESNVGSLLVGDNDRLVGMVTDRDIAMRAVAEEKNCGDATVKDVMSEHVYYCFEDDDLSKAAGVMSEHQVQRLPVLNTDKRLVGVLSVADMARTDKEALASALSGVKAPSDQPRQ
jgi:CBS domain-containing protein